MSEQAATEQLMAHIEALIVEHDRRDAVELVQGVFRSQIAINTQAELENRALREWAAARDVVRALETEERPNWKQLQAADQVERDRRQRLAAEHGLPLPGAGEQ